MLSGQEPSSPHVRVKGPPKTEPDGRREADLCEPIQNSLHDIVKGAQSGHSESVGSHEHTPTGECEKRTFEIGELERGVSDLQPSTRSLERRLTLRTSESHPHSSGVEEQEDHDEVPEGSLERVSKDTQPQSAGSDDVLHGPEAAREIENPGPRQSPPSSQPVAPSALPLHLIPLLPQKSPSSKRQRRSIGLSSDQTDEVADDFSGRGSPGQPNATGGTNPSPQSLRLRLQNFSAESAGISRTLAYAMDQMNATHSSDYLPLRRAEPEKLVVTREAEVDREGDVATRPKTVRFEESTCPPAELAERLWTDAIQAVNTAHAHEESDQKTERAAQSDEQDEGATCGQDATIGGKNTASGKGEIPEGDVWSFLRKLGAVTLGKAEEGQSKDATWEMDAKARRAATEGISRTVAPQVGWRMEDAGNEAERAALALKPAQLQEYTRLKEQEVELRNAEAEIRTFEERLEAREKDLRTRLGTVRKRLEAIRQRRASINHQEEILRQKLEAVTKEAQGSANALGAVAPPESN